jgi:ATP-dependent RNA helicase MSS116
MPPKAKAAAAEPDCVHVDATEEPRFSDVRWEDVPFDASVVRKAMASSSPELQVLTKVQRHVFEAGARDDVYAVASTGSGKTLAFVAPAVEGMLRGELKCALLLSITNVLKDQHARVASEIAEGVAAVFRVDAKGSPGPRIRAAERSIVVATPAAVLKLARDPEFAEWLVQNVGLVVVDEIDALLADPSSRQAVTEVAAMCTGANVRGFTATHTDRSLAWMREVSRGERLVYVDAGDQTGASAHTHEVLIVDSEHTLPALHALLSAEADAAKIMIFFNTNMLAEFAHAYLTAAGHAGLYRMHSRMGSASKLRRAQAEFQACEECTVLCSDVAARGMDFAGVTLVVQVGYAPPDKYVQRVGRSGRGTSTGRGVLLINRAEAETTLKGLKAEGVVPVEYALSVPENTVNVHIPTAVKAYKSLFGAYSALKWEMDAIDEVVRPMFAGAGQDVSTWTAPEKKGSRGGGRERKSRGQDVAAWMTLFLATAVLSILPR